MKPLPGSRIHYRLGDVEKVLPPLAFLRQSSCEGFSAVVGDAESHHMLRMNRQQQLLRALRRIYIRSARLLPRPSRPCHFGLIANDIGIHGRSAGHAPIPPRFPESSYPRARWPFRWAHSWARAFTYPDAVTKAFGPTRTLLYG